MYEAERACAAAVWAGLRGGACARQRRARGGRGGGEWGECPCGRVCDCVASGRVCVWGASRARAPA
eukprot:3091089-Prymnesium_polylepis.1